MGRSARSIIGMLFLSALLAGCIGGEELEAEDQEEETDHQKGLGVLTGRIFDTGLDPIQGAIVRLALESDLVAEVTTNEAGRYEIRSIEPGQYRLQVSATCCQESVRAVLVTADKEVTADLQLEPFSQDDLQEPRVERHEWTGQIGCSVRVNGSGYNLGCADPNDNRVHDFQIKRGLKTLLVGMDWDPVTDNVNEELVLRHYRGTSWDGNTFFRINSDPPLEIRVDEEDATDGEDLYYSNIEDSWDVRFQVWTGGTNSISYQQPFTVYYELHYWEPAPEGATALPDL